MTELRVATLTISDSRTAADDRSGQRLTELLRAAGVELLPHRILPDEIAALRAFIRGLAGAAEAAVLTGGTGIAPRDCTIEALAPLLDKRLDGFGEAFRRLSWDQIGPTAVLSRALAGVVGGVVVFALPGSVGAVELGVSALVLPVLRHAVDLAQGRTGHRERLA